MRVAFFILLLANLLFLAWAEWIAVPALHADPLADVPRLQLVDAQAAAPPTGAAAAPAPAGALGTALAAQAGSTAVQSGAQALKCVAIGPFNRHHDVVEAVAVLHAKHFAPVPRVEATHPVPWYWAYVPDESSDVRVREALAKLRHAGIGDAEPMSAINGRPGISLGLFHDRALAQHQVARARAKGFKARLTERLVAQPAYWVDVWAAGGAGTLPMRALHKRLGTTLGTQSCPAGDAPPLPNNATGAVTSGVPLPSDQASAAPPP